MDTSIQRLLRMKKVRFWINAHTPIENQSNQAWNTPIHLKINGPHIKVPLIFWFQIMIFNLCFYHQLGIKWVCIHIGISSRYIGQTIPEMSVNVWHWMKCSSNWHPGWFVWLTTTSPTRHQYFRLKSKKKKKEKRKKTILHVVHLIILCTSTETSIYWKFKDKTFNLLF